MRWPEHCAKNPVAVFGDKRCGDKNPEQKLTTGFATTR
jgi:hypothetical protein